MNKEQLEARRTIVANKINQIKQELTPVASRIVAFRAVGFIAGVGLGLENKSKMVGKAFSRHWGRICS